MLLYLELFGGCNRNCIFFRMLPSYYSIGFFSNILIIISFIVPVDHTFFLANFCTASLASSMMATFIPKATTATTSSYSPQQRSTSSSAAATAASAYETKKLNGNLQQQQQANGGHEVEHLRSKNGGRTISQSDYGSGIYFNDHILYIV